MALIRNAKGRKVGGGYNRLFGDDRLAHLMSRVHSAVISSGTELERLIKERITLIDDLDTFLQQETMPDGVLVADKQKVKSCKKLDFLNSEPDFMIFRRRESKQRCHLVELKDGDTFDTKKAAAERQSMYDFIKKNAQHLPYIVESHFCCFNQDDKKAIHEGFKKKIDIQEAMTGREFCNLLELDYDDIIDFRKTQSSGNLDYFLVELVKIESVKDWLKGKFFG